MSYQYLPQSLVLLIDDSSIDNFVNQKMIERNNFSKEVISFKKVGNAIKYLSDLDEQQNDDSAIPSLIFLDINMPLINGFQFIEIYENFSSYIKSRCKIVILTNTINPIEINQINNNKNILAFLNKPLIDSNFVKIHELLRENSEQSELKLKNVG
ncbi:MAG: response regulator [Bacteroidetes bacterium]|nr:response regulator [Bacteroidota bacterium]